MKKISLYIQEMRVPFFTGTIVPILLGTAAAWYKIGDFNINLMFLTLLGGVLLHGAANAANDYFDHLSGTDTINTEFVNPFTGGSRLIQKGLLTPHEVLIEAVILYCAGSLIGLWLAYTCGWPILWIGLFGVATSFFYTAPPFKLVHRGIGEILIGINFGVLMVVGAYYVQTTEFSPTPIMISIPVALLIMAILYINEFQDFNADKTVGKNNWVVRLGRKNAVRGYVALILGAYAFILIGVLTKHLTIFSLIAFLTVPMAIRAILILRSNYESPATLVQANALTIKLHLIIGLLLTLGYVSYIGLVNPPPVQP